MLVGDSPSWEDAQLVIIAKDRHLLNSFQTLKYINVALLTLLLYDYCLTFNLEKRRIWTLHWKLPKCLFMFNRYILPPIFFFEGFSNAVNVGHTMQVFLTIGPPCDVRIFTPIPRSAAILTVELMLILRVLALYGNSSALARFLVIQFFVQMILGAFFAIFLIARTRSCLYDLPNWASLTWTPLFVVESILVVLTIYKCRKYGEFTPTIKILARDSAIYFVCISSIIILNITYARQYKLIGMALALPTSVLTSIAAARLSMNIRAITVERGIAMLSHQTHLPTLFSFTTGHSSSNSASANSVQAISSRTGVPQVREEEGELEGGYYDDDGDDEGLWRQEQDEAIIQEDRSSRSEGDVKRAVV
ncbi:hypothetical protein BYT27DRAFT_7238073 [Phlegmacium glaucopus]|nr:hypothetical protein BYT27DRAFT_7238073 [Phlegmacium glaucopus]